MLCCTVLRLSVSQTSHRKGGVRDRHEPSGAPPLSPRADRPQEVWDEAGEGGLGHLQRPLHRHAEEELPKLEVGDGAHVVDVVTRALLTNDEVVEEGLFEHVSPGAVRGEGVPERITTALW